MVKIFLTDWGEPTGASAAVGAPNSLAVARRPRTSERRCRPLRRLTPEGHRRRGSHRRRSATMNAVDIVPPEHSRIRTGRGGHDGTLPRFLCQSAIRKSHDLQPSQRHSVYEVPGRRGRHKALRRAGDLTARGPQRSGQHGFEFGVGHGFGRRVEHLHMLHRVGAQNKNTRV